MSGAYEVHMGDTEHIVRLPNESNETIDQQNVQITQTSNGARSEHQSSSTSGSEERNETNKLNDSQTSMEGSGGVMKIPNSYKYPLLRRYYEFGPWVGRNRKAKCLGCGLTTSSSQPDRLLKHLNRCTALTEADKVAVTDLMNERTANKRKKPVNLRLKHEDDSYYGDDHCNAGSADDLTEGGHNTISIASGGFKRVKRDHGDKNSQIDEALTRFIMTCRIPLKAIHSPEFVELVRSLNPDYHIPSRETITNVLIPGMLNII